MEFSRSFVAVTLMTAALPLCAQAPSPEPQVFGEAIDVRVVNVEAVVTDEKGERVRGLAAADFRLLVDGKEVPVEYFTEVADGTATAAGTAAPVSAGETVARSYLIYIDESFSIPGIRNEVLEKLERDLALLGPDDRMAVLAFDGSRIQVLSGWTGDRALLAAAFQRARLRPAHGGEMLAHERKLQADVDWVIVSADSLDDGDTSGPSAVGAILQALEPRISPEARTQLGKTASSAAASLRGFEVPPGRKVMLMLSGAWSLGVAPRLYGPMIEAANRLGYTIYPVDVAQSHPKAVTALGALAERTGGKVLVSAKMEAFRQVVEDAGSYYWLGFTPDWKADDRGRRVVVEARRKDLRVRSRNGFSDLSPRTENAMKAESVLLFGGVEAERRLVVQIGQPRRAGRGEVEIPVTLGVPVEALALTPKGRGFVAETPLSVAAMDGGGGRSDLPGSRLRVEIQKPPGAGTFARFQTVVRLRDTQQRLVFTVHDPVEGKAIWGEATFAPKTKQAKK